jgi:hypothetical protein
MPGLTSSPSRVPLRRAICSVAVQHFFQAELTALDNFGRQSRHLKERFADLANRRRKPFPPEKSRLTTAHGYETVNNASKGLIDIHKSSNEYLRILKKFVALSVA